MTTITNVKTTIIIILFTLILTACNIDQLLPDSTNVDFRKGTQGLIVDIEGENDIITYGHDTSTNEAYIIKIENKGATDIPQEGFFMKIHHTSDFLRLKNGDLLIDSLKTFNIDTMLGKSKYNSKGDYIEHLLVFQGTPPFNQGATASISVDTCYLYETILSKTICINTQINKNNKGCKKDTYSFSQGQGGPMKISKAEIKETIKPGTDDVIIPKIILTIENSGGNIFTLPESFKQACLEKKDINRFRISDAKLGTMELDCNGEIVMKDKSKKIVCTPDAAFGESLGVSFDTILYIKLEYGYLETATKNINVIRESYTS